MSLGSTKIGFLVVGIVPILISSLLVGTAGIKGFNGTGGSDTPLFQLITYVSIPVLLGGLLALVTAFRPNRLLALVAGILLIPPGLFLSLLSPLYGGPMVVLGIVAIVLRRKIPKA